MSPGPKAGFEIFVLGRQDLFARRTLIPLAGAPISFGTSTRTLFFVLAEESEISHRVMLQSNIGRLGSDPQPRQ